MHVIRNNDVKVYEISSNKSVPHWLDERKKRKMLKTLEHRIEILQDFSMPTSTTNVTVTPDCNYIMSSGIYKPRIKCYDVNELSLKFERCLDSEIVKFAVLSEDYAKMVLLLNDRHLEIHSQEGMYYRLRIPTYGRDIVYDYYTCDLNISSKGPEIYRLNLESGQFYQPYYLDSQEGTILCLNYDYHFILAGTEKGQLWAFDPRVREKICSIDLSTSFSGVSALSFRDNINFGVGMANGISAIYDVRSSSPLVYKDHMYGEAVKKISFINTLNGGDYIMSSDSHSLKIYDRHTLKMFTSIEPIDPINDFCVYPNSGLIFFANESPNSGIYFVPSLGSAPKFCSYLDNLTEEMEEVYSNQIYDDYKFVTRHELDELGLSNLIGTEALRAYMHGFFIDIRLYKKAKSAHNPMSYKEYKQNTVKQKIQEERSERLKLIVFTAKLPDVNKELAEQLLNRKLQITGADVKNPTGDKRFNKLFLDPDFQIDPDNEHYRLLKNVGAIRKTKLQPSIAPTEEFSENEFLKDELDVLEDVDSDDNKVSDQQEYELTSINNQYNLFSAPNSDNMTLEDKLKLNKTNQLNNNQEVVVGDKTIQYIPEDNKKKNERLNFEKLKQHINEKKNIRRNNTKKLPFQTKKFLSKGVKRLKFKSPTPF
ncbi:hypothetical protein MXB_4160 [Myxobolus squamalis]|nr:hypothetical protein MXB_4160 [Myxobolus squamalis]